MSDISDNVKACFLGKAMHQYCTSIPYDSKKERLGNYNRCMYQGLATSVKVKKEYLVFYKCMRGYKK